ncbi:hypothetical protein AOLI_G00292170 [Acnodon oligacanthus]
MGILADYLQKWHLQLSAGKTLAAAYHLNNREARRGLYVAKNCLEFQQAPKYLGVHLDRTLSYKQHLDFSGLSSVSGTKMSILEPGATLMPALTGTQGFDTCPI